MTGHIDVFVNDWSNGVQRRVARVSVVTVGAEKQILVDCCDDERYKEVVLRPIADPVTGHEIYQWKMPEDFFGHLPGSFRGSHLSATEPHEMAECPFAEVNVIPFESADQTLVLPG